MSYPSWVYEQYPASDYLYYEGGIYPGSEADYSLYDGKVYPKGDYSFYSPLDPSDPVGSPMVPWKTEGQYTPSASSGEDGWEALAPAGPAPSPYRVYRDPEFEMPSNTKVFGYYPHVELPHNKGYDVYNNNLIEATSAFDYGWPNDSGQRASFVRYAPSTTFTAPAQVQILGADGLWEWEPSPNPVNIPYVVEAPEWSYWVDASYPVTPIPPLDISGWPPESPISYYTPPVQPVTPPPTSTPAIDLGNTWDDVLRWHRNQMPKQYDLPDSTYPQGVMGTELITQTTPYGNNVIHKGLLDAAGTPYGYVTPSPTISPSMGGAWATGHGLLGNRGHNLLG